MTTTPQDNFIQEAVERFEKTFYNEDIFSSHSQFKPEMQGRLPEAFKSFIVSELEAQKSHIKETLLADENTSDGYHTFKELYEYRLLYNAALFNEWAEQGKYNVHKSQRHNDGELCFGRNDYFIVVATLPTGQISNHYPMSDWDLFKCEAKEKALEKWDGHSAKDVADRLRQTLTARKEDRALINNI